MNLGPLHCQSDILSEIMQFISQYERLTVIVLVSTQFRNAVYQSIDKLHLRGECHGQTIRDILSRFPSLRELELSFCKTLTDQSMSWILERYAKLVKLCVVHCTNLKILDIPSHQATELEHLEITGNKLNKASISCTRLEYLDASGTCGFSDEDILLLLSRNNQLRTVLLKRIPQLSSLIGMSSRNLETLCLERCKNLKELSFKHVPSLRVLDLSFTRIDDPTLSSLMGSDQLDKWSLSEIKLDGCKSLRNPFIHNRSIKNISFDFCSNLERPKLECASLKRLSINHTNVVDHALESIIKHNEGITCLFARNNLRIVRPKIRAAEHHCIEEIDFRGCHWMESIHFPATASPMRLQRMDLSYTRISDDTIKPVTRDCFALRDLSLCTCDYLIDPVIESESIERLDFSGAHALNSPSIRCSNITEMHVENCHNLNPAAVQSVIEAIEHRAVTPVTFGLPVGKEEKCKGETRMPNVRRRLIF